MSFLQEAWECSIVGKK